MKYLLTAITLLAFAGIGYQAHAADKAVDTKERISNLQAQIKGARMEVKSLRATERVEKAVSKFCDANPEDNHYVICQQGPWVTSMTEGTTTKGTKASKR